MDRLLRRISKRILTDSLDEQKYNKYRQMMDVDGWQVHREYLIILKGLIANELLGSKFTELPPIEKDVEQRAYAMVDKMIMFLLDPLQEARKAVRVTRHNKKQMGVTQRGNDQKGKTNG